MKQIGIVVKGVNSMEYTKPVVVESSKANGAKCGGGPCGRPK